LSRLIQLNQTFQKQPDSLLKAAGLRSLGNTLRVVGDLDQSEQVLQPSQVLQQSLEIAQKLKSPSDIGAALLSLGNTAYSQQDTQAALKFFQQAADVSVSPMARTQAKLNELRLLSETKSWSNALALWPQIQPEIAELPPSRSAVYARINLAQSLSRLRQGSAAEPTPSWLEIDQLLATAVEQAKNLEDQRAQAYALGYLGGIYEQTTQWSNAQKLTQQALILAQAINAPDIGYRWQWQLGRILKAQGDTTGAIASYTQAVEDLKSLRNNLVGVNPDIQFSFREQVEPIYRQLVDLLLQQEPTQPKLAQARNVIESLQLAELNNFFRVACLEDKVIDLDELVDKQDPTAAVVYPIILPDRLEVIVKLPKQKLRHYKTAIAQDEVEKLLEGLRRNLVEPEALLETQSLSKQLYDLLVRPAEVDLAKTSVKTLVFVLDGGLRNIPMASLYDGQQYLVQKYAIALSPGLQLLAPKSLEPVKLKALTAGLTEARNGFSALKGVSVELDQIKSELPSTILLNQNFTSKALQTKTEESTFPIIHLATHGEFSSQIDKTFILAWDKRVSVDELNNIIQARGSSTSSSLIELLVLSACETATGDKRAALGLAGVAVQSGARSTIASLWSVQDQPTAALMNQFYKNLANSHMTKAEALRQAQITLLKQSAFQRPISWAPYVLIGSWL